MGDIYSLQIPPNIRTRGSTDSFIVPFCKKEIARKLISYLGSKIWNDSNQDIKLQTVFKRRFYTSFKEAFLQIVIEYLKSNKN